MKLTLSCDQQKPAIIEINHQQQTFRIQKSEFWFESEITLNFKCCYFRWDAVQIFLHQNLLIEDQE